MKKKLRSPGKKPDCGVSFVKGQMEKNNRKGSDVCLFVQLWPDGVPVNKEGQQAKKNPQRHTCQHIGGVVYK